MSHTLRLDVSKTLKFVSTLTLECTNILCKTFDCGFLNTKLLPNFSQSNMQYYNYSIDEIYSLLRLLVFYFTI